MPCRLRRYKEKLAKREQSDSFVDGEAQTLPVLYKTKDVQCHKLVTTSTAVQVSSECVKPHDVFPVVLPALPWVYRVWHAMHINQDQSMCNVTMLWLCQATAHVGSAWTKPRTTEPGFDSV